MTKRRNQQEAKGPAGKPKCPAWLDADAKAAWQQLIPMLDAMGVLTKIDGNALIRYCRYWSRWRKAEDWIEKHGEMYPIKDEAGRVRCFQQWPQVAVSHKLCHELTRIEAEFGMTPSARTRIHITPQQILGKSKLGEFFSGSRVPIRTRY